MILVLALAAGVPGLGAGDGGNAVLAAAAGRVAAEVPACEPGGADHDCHESLQTHGEG